MEIPDRVHFFSWHTKTSLELPVGFEEQSDDEGSNTVIYADDLDDDDPPGARVMAKATAVPVGDDDAYRKLADASAQIPGRGTESRTEVEIDGLPAIRQLLRYYHDDLEEEVIRHETFAQAGNIVFSITGMALAEDGHRYLDDLDHASDTARFILL